MAAMLEFHNFLLAQKRRKNEVGYNVQVILLKFKMATTSRLFINICDRNNPDLIYDWG